MKSPFKEFEISKCLKPGHYIIVTKPDFGPDPTNVGVPHIREDNLRLQFIEDALESAILEMEGRDGN